MNGGLRRRRRLEVEEEVNPLDGAINIVDAMLVFACALIIALVIHWNVDPVKGGVQVDATLGQELPGETELRSDLTEAAEEGQGQFYERLGSVYRDPVSGKLFILAEDEEE